MRRNLKSSLANRSILLVFTVVTILMGGVSLLMGYFCVIILPLLIAVLASLYLFDQKSLFSTIASSILILLNIVGYVYGINYYLFSLAAVVIALLISTAFAKDQSKSDTAFIAMLVSAGLTVAAMLLSVMMESGSFDIDNAIKYYTDWYKDTRQDLAEISHKYYSFKNSYISESFPEYKDMLVQDLTVESFAKRFDYTFNGSAIACLILMAFTCVGIAMKIFGFIVRALSEDNGHIRQWRFVVSTPFALFYVLLSFAYIFVDIADNIFAITVENLFYIFLAIFAYLGFKFLVSLLSKKIPFALSFLIVVAASLVLFSVSPYLLASVGVVSTIRANAQIPSKKD